MSLTINNRNVIQPIVYRDYNTIEIICHPVDKLIDRSVMQKLMSIPRGWIFGLGGAVFAAAALKIGLLVVDAVPFNADEAIVALMARHILQGETPIFFYGQAYMGSLDAYIVAAVFKLIGIQVWGVRFVQIVLYSLTIVTTAILGKQLAGNWRVGVLAAWFMGVPNIGTTLYTTVSLGGYGEMLLIGNLILLITLIIARDISRKQVKLSIIPWFGLGIVSGFGLWVFGLTLVYSLPAFLYLAWCCLRLEPNRRREYFFLTWWKSRMAGAQKKEFVKQSRVWGVALVGFAIGGSPWWAFANQTGIYNLLSELGGGAISGVESLNPVGQVLHHALNLGLYGSTVMLGLRPPWEIRWLALPLIPMVLIFWGGVVVFAYKRTLTDLQLGFQDADYTHAPLLVGVVLMVFVGFIFSPFGADPSGRYFLPVGVVMTLFAAQAVLRWLEKWRRSVGIVVGLIFLFHILGSIQVAQSNPPGVTTQFDAVTQIDHRYDQELIDFLIEQGEIHGYTNYWVSYPLAFLSDERLVYVPRLPYHQDLRYTSRDDRYQPYDQIVAQAERIAYITTNNPSLDKQLRIGFTELDVDWKEVEIGDYLVYYQLSRRVKPEEIGLGGNEG
jgi:hypothetical protein